MKTYTRFSSNYSVKCGLSENTKQCRLQNTERTTTTLWWHKKLALSHTHLIFETTATWWRASWRPRIWRRMLQPSTKREKINQPSATPTKSVKKWIGRVRVGDVRCSAVAVWRNYDSLSMLCQQIHFQLGQIKYISNLDEYIVQFGQIHCAIWTNTLCNLDKYINETGESWWHALQQMLQSGGTKTLFLSKENSLCCVNTDP